MESILFGFFFASQCMMFYSASPLSSWIILMLTSIALMYILYLCLGSSFMSFLVLLVFVGGIMILFIFLSSIYPNEINNPMMMTVFFFFFFFFSFNSYLGDLEGFKTSLLHLSIYIYFLSMITLSLTFFLYLCSFKGISMRSFLYFPFSLIKNFNFVIWSLMGMLSMT